MGRPVHLLTVKKAETSVIDGANQGINFCIRIGMKQFIVQQYQDGIWKVGKDESPRTRKGSALYFIDGKMEQYESPGCSPGDD